MDNEFPTATHNSMDTALAVIKEPSGPFAEIGAVA